MVGSHGSVGRALVSEFLFAFVNLSSPHFLIRTCAVLKTFDVQFFITPIYPEAKKRVELGNILSPDDVDLAPDLELSSFPEISSVDEDTVYTLVLSDPDALSHDNPVKSQMCHWIVTNVTLPATSASHAHPKKLLSLMSEDTSGIIQLKKYFPPAPPPKTGYHRYVFAFLKSTSKDSPIPKKPKKRAHWGYGKVGAGIKEWAAENELEVVGEYKLTTLSPCHSTNRDQKEQISSMPRTKSSDAVINL